MVNFKLELTSSPDTPPLRSVNERSRLCREQSNRSPMELVLAGNTPGGEAGPSLTTEFRQSDSEPDSDDNADETGEAETSDKPHKPPQRPPRTQSGLYKGNTQFYVKAIAEYCSTVTIPRTTLS
ncbi:hypothetical protein B9Z19DRAFT_1126143 [Tuber borchii]|uniref:Uncharacterized protein n=1 Tax=Tuber borchii TaxID=42251 RepID=A0A2T6ZTH3_TUBBO|nr:hypothetical protein B9Z19DRAFT_1126143 [Tuber borchii]